MIKNIHLFLLPDDLITYIFKFDNTYHNIFNEVKKELLIKTRLLYIVLEARYSNYILPNKREIIYEYKDTNIVKQTHTYNNVFKLYYKYHLINKI